MRTLKQLLLVALAIASIASCSNKKQNQEKPKTPVEINGALSVSGTQLVNQKGEPVVLKGVSYGWHQFWPRFYNKQSLNYLVDEWGCTLLRAAMGIELEGAYLDDQEKAVQCVTTVVDAAIEKGVYVIIDWHSHHIRLNESKEFFTRMATLYQGVPNVIYEIYNEPESDTWPEIKAYSEDVISTIRSIDTSAIILVGTPHWDQDVNDAADDQIADSNNLMYTLHFYADTHKQELRDKADYALSKGLPLFVSECAGMSANGDGPINVEEWNNWQEWIKKNNLSWIAWSVSDKDESCSMLTPQSASEGNWTDAQVKEWGKIVKAQLAK